MIVSIARWILKLVDLSITVEETSVRLVVFVGGVKIVDRVWKVLKNDKSYTVNAPKGVL